MYGCTPQPTPPLNVTAPEPASGRDVIISPVSRVNGALQVELEIQGGKVTCAQTGSRSHWDFESRLKGRDPRDLIQFTQRMDDNAPCSHAMTCALAVERALGATVNQNARVLRNLAVCLEFVQTHIGHFYQQALPDYLSTSAGSAGNPPRYLHSGSPVASADSSLGGGWRGLSGPQAQASHKRQPLTDVTLPPKTLAVLEEQYVQALEVRRSIHVMLALLGGRSPQIQAFVAGGMAESPSREKQVELLARLKPVREFVEEKYLSSVYALANGYKGLFGIGQSYGRLFSCGALQLDAAGKNFVFKRGVNLNGLDSPFDPRLINTDTRHSWLPDSLSGRNFRNQLKLTDAEKHAALDKKDAYSFLPAMRYADQPLECGPAARMWLTNPAVSANGEKLLRLQFGLKVKRFRDLGLEVAFSVMGRHIARAEEALFLLGFAERWIKELKPGEKTFIQPGTRSRGEGLGLSESPSGALLHYVRLNGGLVDAYQIITPGMWNCSPKDAQGVLGPLERALTGVAVPDKLNPVQAGRVIRSW